MRRWHRWLAVFFGVFLFWIAATGLLSQAADLLPDLGAPDDAAAAGVTARAAAATPPEGFVCPKGWRCRPPEVTSGLGSLKGFFHHLHSGDEFGPAGIALSVMSGLALLFFSGSGLWVYVKMWTNRRARAQGIGLFWK